MAIIVADGAETGNTDMVHTLTVSGGGAVTVDSAVKRSGGYSYKCACPTSGLANIVCCISKAADQGAFYGSAWIFIPTGGTPSAETRILQLASAASSRLVITLDSSRVLRLKDSPEATTYGTSAAITENAWHQLEIHCDNVAGTTNATIEAWINGSSFGATTGVSVSTLNALIIGFHTTSVTGTIHFDDIVLRDGTGGVATGRAGLSKIVHKQVASAGDMGNAGTQGTDWDTGPGTGGVAHEQLDEGVPADDATSYIELIVNSSGATNRVLDFGVQTNAAVGIGSSDTIVMTGVGIRLTGETTASCQYIRRLKSQSAGTALESTTGAVASTDWHTNDDSGLTFLKPPAPFSHTDPQSGGAWTPALLDTAQIGVRSPDATPDVWVSAMWMMVIFDAAVGGGFVPFPRPRGLSGGEHLLNGGMA